MTAFEANFRAKAVSGSSRADCYRIKHEAINELVKKYAAFADTIDLTTPEPTIGVAFVGSGKLHIKRFGLDRHALKVIRVQLICCLAPPSAIAAVEAWIN